tara:strand:- start:1857 stop:2543 length:687 start_codon:yes stop_codon:yes gene_type:complete
MSYKCESNDPNDIKHFKQMNKRQSEIAPHRLECNDKLSQIADKYKDTTDKCPTTTYWRKHAYTELYGPLLRQYSDKEITMLEIGVRWGGSLLMWSDFFANEKSIVHGIDIQNQLTPSVEEEIKKRNNISLHFADAYSDSTINTLFKDTTFDFILDDGSHKEQDQIKYFNKYYKLLNEGGIMICEDFYNVDQARRVIDGCDLKINNLSIVLRNQCIPSGKGEIVVMYKE